MYICILGSSLKPSPAWQRHVKVVLVTGSTAVDFDQFSLEYWYISILSMTG